MSNVAPPDDFNDAIRRAAGLPTEAEKKAKDNERLLAQKALADDLPRRNVAIQLFRTTVFPKIRSTFAQIQVNITDAPFTIQELNIMGGGLPQYLAQYGFMSARKGLNPMVGAKPLPTLYFYLKIDETLVIDISAGQKGRVVPAVQVPLAQIDVETAIPKAFLDFVAAIRSSL